MAHTKKTSSKILVTAFALALTLSACGGFEETSAAGQATSDTLAPSFEASAADVSRWTRPGGCDGSIGLTAMVDNIANRAAWVLVENDTAIERFIENPTFGVTDGREIGPQDVDAVLAGEDASLGAAIHPDRYETLKEVLAAGAALIIPSLFDRDLPATSPEPQRGFAAVLPDGRMAWLGSCGFMQSDPYNEYLAEIGGDRTTTIALFSADKAVLSAFDAWYADSVTGPDPDEDWLATPADSRSVDIEDTPAHVLDGLGTVNVLMEIPEDWRDWDVTICGRSDLGWLGCFNTGVGTTVGDMLVEPGSEFVLTLLDGSARFSSRMEDVATVSVELVSSLIDSDQALRVTPIRSFVNLADFRGAATDGAVMQLDVIPLEEALESLPSGDRSTPNEGP